MNSLASVDALEVVARLSYAQISHHDEGVADIGVERPHLYQVEQLQAFALSKPRVTQRSDPGAAAILSKRAMALLSQNAKAYLGRPKRKYVKDRLLNEREELLSLIQRWTLAVRGVRTPPQTINYSATIAEAVDVSFRGVFDCGATEVLRALAAAVAEFDRNLQDFRTASRSWNSKKTGIGMIDAFVRNLRTEDAAEVRAKVLPHRYERARVRSMLREINEASLVECFSIELDRLKPSVDELSWPQVRAVLLKLAFEFGELEDEVLEHLQLANPIRTRPFVKVGNGKIFCSSPHILVIGLAEIMEGLYALHPGLKETSEKARADWLEDHLESVVRTYLPSADVYRSVRWNDGEDAETDLVAVIDQTVLVFEAKSAKIHPSARRGALNSLKGALSDLVVAPSRQSLKFKRRLEQANGPVEFDADEGRRLRIDPKQVRDIIRVNILHDVVGPLSSHWPQLKAAGLLPSDLDVAPTMSIFDLENVFDVLSFEVERCHYLSRRAEIERNCSYTADELDLLSLYLDNQFNIGEQEFDGKHHQYYGRSLEIGYALTRRQLDSTVSLRVHHTELWERLLRSLEGKKPPGWTRFGHRLLNASLRGQQKIGQLFSEGFKQIERDPTRLFSTGITVGTIEKPNTIAVCVGRPLSDDQFQRNLQYAAQSAFEQGGAESLLILYNFVPRTDEPYDFIGTFYRKRMGEPS